LSTPDFAAIAALEAAAFRAWPAAETSPWRGWVLRATEGVTRRANSVWVGGACGPELDEGIDVVEAFYRARDLPAAFQMSGGRETPSLEARLAARGYRQEGLVDVQSAPVGDVCQSDRAVSREISLEVRRELTEDWFDISARQGRYRDVAPIYRALLERIGDRARYALARLDGTPAAVALLVHDRESEAAGVFAMQTLPPFRRRGLAQGLLGAVAKEAAEKGVGTLYLQVEIDNAAARSLYGRCGFRSHHGYHYRVLGTALCGTDHDAGTRC
jgi:GNAT superfamily N-acetyltransferase